MFWLWLLLYGLLFAVPRALAPAAAPLLTPALLAVYWAVLLRYLHTRGRLRSYGLCRGRGLTARDALLSLPGAAVRRAQRRLRRRVAGSGGGGVSALCRVRRGGAVSRRAAGRLGRKARRGQGGRGIGGALCAFASGQRRWRERFRRRGAGAVRLRRGAAADGGARKDRSIALPLLAHALINLTGSGAVSAAPQAAAYLAASALCTLCALRLLRDAA